jgi:hypothetical protein
LGHYGKISKNGNLGAIIPGNPFAIALVDMASISTLWLVSATPIFLFAATGGVKHPGA